MKKQKVITSFLYAFGILFLVGCASLNFTPKPTLEERQFIRERAIESFMRKKVPAGERYESFGFGPVTVIKPPSFLLLDSLYDIKAGLLERNELRELKQSGIQDQIDEQRTIARKDESLLQFEIEHIFLRNVMDSIYIHHDLFLLNQNDSVILHSPFYSYQLPRSDRNIWMKYLFELHFLTAYDFGISTEELAFIRFIKEREQELIRTPALNAFMLHAMELMKMAESLNSVDFVKLSKFMVIKFLRETTTKPDRLRFGPLNANENEFGEIIGYQIDAEWFDASSAEIPNKGTFRFNPYLQLMQ